MAELIYFADPMCSWCYGFEQEFEYVRNRHELPVRLVLGGLFPGSRAPILDDGLREYLRQTWTKVSQMSGQPFSMEFIERADPWVYDTEPACRAVVTMRAFAPHEAFSFFSKIQHAFYEHGRDVTRLEELRPLLRGYSVSENEFVDAFNSDEMRALTREDFATSYARGVQGFPTVFLRDKGSFTPVARGYRRGVDVSRTIFVMLAPPAEVGGT